MNEKDHQPKRGHSVDSSYPNEGSNNHHHQKDLFKNSIRDQDEETLENSSNALSTRSLFDENHQRKTSISFDKIKQLTLALSSGEDLDISQIDPALSSINDHKTVNCNNTYNESSLECRRYNDEQQQLNSNNHNLNHNIFSSSSSAEEATSEYIHQNELYQSISRNHSSSSLLNTTGREKQPTNSFTKLDQSATRLAIGPDNEQDSGLESEFGPSESMAHNSKFNHYNDIDLLPNIDINSNRIPPSSKGYDKIYEYKNRNYIPKHDTNNLHDDNRNQSNILRPNSNVQYTEESHITPSQNKFLNMNSSAPSLTRNMSDNFSYNSSRTSKLDDLNSKQLPERYFGPTNNPEIDKFSQPLDAVMSNFNDEQYNPYGPKSSSDNTYSFNVSTRSPQRIRHRYMIRGNGLMEDNGRNLGIKLTQTQNNQKVTITMTSHDNFIDQENKLMGEQLTDTHQYQNRIDSMIGAPEHKIRDMNMDSRKILGNQQQGEIYDTNRLDYSVYPTNQRKVYNQDDDYEKSLRQSPQVEWSNVPRAVSRNSSNYEGSSGSRARSRSPQSECSSTRIQRTGKIINPNTEVTHDKVDDEDTNNYSYPQTTINAGNSHSFGQDGTYSSPTKFPTRPYESAKSDYIMPSTNNIYNPYKTDDQDRPLTTDDYATITTNYSVNNNRNQKLMQVMTKISSPISSRRYIPGGLKNDRFTEQSMNNSRMPTSRLSNCNDALQIDVEGTDLRSDNDGGIEIVIGNMINQSPARTKSRNPFLSDEYLIPSSGGAIDLSNSTQNSSYHLGGPQQNSSYRENPSEFNQYQQQPRSREGIKYQSDCWSKTSEKRENELSLEHLFEKRESSLSRDPNRRNFPNDQRGQKLKPTTLSDGYEQYQGRVNNDCTNSLQSHNNNLISTDMTCGQANHESLDTIDRFKGQRTQSTKETILTTNTKKEITQSIYETKKTECPAKPDSETIQMKPIKLRNLTNGNQTVDTLHQTTNKPVGCTYLHCMGSIINPEPVNHSVRSSEDILEQAKQFLNQYYTSIKRLNSPAHNTRIEEIKEQIKLTRTYYLKETELIFGAKLAWRNAPRCIGRIQWSKLQVFDARFTTTTHEMFEAVCNHIRYATNKGSLRSAITIFPQRVKSTKYDYRVWNSQLIGYAGYRSSKEDSDIIKIIGDPANADFTEICQKLGWQGKGTRFDVLPLVLSANGGAPQFFPLPEDLVLRVKLQHPKYDWFKELGLEWYALPAVSSMMLDVGGLQFPAAPFSGWYMVTEIGTRDLGDAARYNILEVVAQGLGLDTASNFSLWRDQALVELNLAVLDSYQKAGVTIVDHHTASETFMTHLANEQRLRGGCPADWVWIVPPTGGSTMQVYHQEMVSYHLLPNYEYLEPAWRTYDWSLMTVDGGANNHHHQNQNSHIGSSPLTPSRLLGGLTPRKLRFKEIARAVKFTSKLFGKALSRRIKATILYATETGKSERYANKLAQIFSHAFNVHLMCMNDYDMTCLEHEALLLIVTSTFGNGDPPENGETFARQLHAIKLTGDTTPDMESVNLVSTTTFTRVLSQSVEDPLQQSVCPLSNVRFGVFSLGSTAYPNFCAFGRYVDQTLGELGAERIVKCECGDELCGQEKAFAEWSKMVFRTACDVFCISDNFVTINERTSKWNPNDVKFIPTTNNNKTTKATTTITTKATTTTTTSLSSLDQYGPNIQQDLINMTNKKITPFKLLERRDLHTYDGQGLLPLQTICVDLETLDGMALQFEPGDHVAIYPTNNLNLVQGIIDHMIKHNPQMDPEIVYKILIKREDLDITPAATTSNVNNGSQSGGGGGQTTNNSTTITPNNSNKETNSASYKFHQHRTSLATTTKPTEMSDEMPIVRRSKTDTTKESSPTTMLNTNGGGGTSRLAANIHNVTPCITRTTSDNLNVDIGALADLSIIDNSDQEEQQEQQEQLSNIMQNTRNDGGNGGTGGANDEWILHDRLPVTSIREALMRFLDITTPPSQEFLSILGQFADDVNEKKRLQQLATNSALYEEWKHANCPNLLHVLDQFKSIGFKPALLTQLPLIQPRFYSISSSPTISDSKISLTIGIIRWTTKTGHKREGVCSNYLNRIDKNETIYGYIRSAPSFHMPQDNSLPMILIGPGTGIAPFRSFWQYRYSKFNNNNNKNTTNNSQQSTSDMAKFGCIDLYFGCRNYDARLYKEELDDMVNENVITNLNLAYSRLTTSLKQYVQDKLRDNSDRVRELILKQGAHVYVCGDVAMAEGVHKELQNILGDLSQSDEFLLSLREQNRYHEDIFGAKPSS